MDLSYISDSEEAYEKFFAECDATASCKFILAERHIRSILKAIAGSSALLGVFAYAAEGYNFPPEFDRHVSVKGNKKSVALPNGNRDFLAFAYCLMMEIDIQNIDFHKLLNEFYYHPDGMTESYRMFCGDVILPMKAAVRLLREMASDK